MKKALDWFIRHQLKTGEWALNYAKPIPNKLSAKAKDEQLWVTFKICQI